MFTFSYFTTTSIVSVTEYKKKPSELRTRKWHDLLTPNNRIKSQNPTEVKWILKNGHTRTNADQNESEFQSQSAETEVEYEEGSQTALTFSLQNLHPTYTAWANTIWNCTVWTA